MVGYGALPEPSFGEPDNPPGLSGPLSYLAKLRRSLSLSPPTAEDEDFSDVHGGANGAGLPARPKVPTGSPSAIHDDSGPIRESFSDVLGGANGTNLTAPTAPMARPADRIHAIKLPNGRIQFTNTNDYSGPDVGVEEGARQVRAQPIPSNLGDQRVATRLAQVASRNSPDRVGDVSMMQDLNGNAPRVSELERASGLSALAELQARQAEFGAHKRFSELPPRAQAELGSKNLMEKQYMLDWAASQRQQNERARMAEEAQAAARFPPGSPELQGELDRIGRHRRAQDMMILQSVRTAPISMAEYQAQQDEEPPPVTPVNR